MVYGVFSSERKDGGKTRRTFTCPLQPLPLSRQRIWLTGNVYLISRQGRRLSKETLFCIQNLLMASMDFTLSSRCFYGLAWRRDWLGLCDDMASPAVVDDEIIIDHREFNAIKSAKNGAGAPPIKTKLVGSILRMLSGTRLLAFVMSFIFFVCDLKGTLASCLPAGWLLNGTRGWERVGDVSNVLFTNGVVLKRMEPC